MAMKPIETRYANCLFRSRLEARYAVMFDALGIRWDYELEGFTLNDGTRYLPDFYLPKSGYWVEVKGQSPTTTEVEKMRMLCAGSGKPGAILYGSPGAEPVIVMRDELCETMSLQSWLMVGLRQYRSAIEAARSARFEHGQSGAYGVWVPAHG